MGNELFRSYYVGCRGRHQILEVYVARDQEVAFIGAAEYENVIRVRQAISQSPCPREQRFSFGEIYRQHS